MLSISSQQMHLRPVPVIAKKREKKKKKKALVHKRLRKREIEERGHTDAGRKRQKKSYIMYITLRRPVNLSVPVCVETERALS